MLTYKQFLWRWMRKNKIAAIFWAGENEANIAYQKYRKTGKIPLTKQQSVVS